MGMQDDVARASIFMFLFFKRSYEIPGFKILTIQCKKQKLENTEHLGGAVS